MDHNEFDNDRHIEPSQLDVEAVRQADLFFKWAQRAVAARAEMERQEFALKVLGAKLDLRCREKPEEFGLIKTSETAYKATVQSHSKYVAAQEALLKAQETSALLDKAVIAMQQRKDMLEILVKLHGQQYFAGPSVPRDLVSAWRDHEKQTTEGVNERQRKQARHRVKKEGGV